MVHGLDRAVDEHRLHVAPFAAELDPFTLVQRADVEFRHALLAVLQSSLGLGPAAGGVERAVVFVAERVAQRGGAAIAENEPGGERDDHDDADGHPN